MAFDERLSDLSWDLLPLLLFLPGLQTNVAFVQPFVQSFFYGRGLGHSLIPGHYIHLFWIASHRFRSAAKPFPSFLPLSNAFLAAAHLRG